MSNVSNVSNVSNGIELISRDPIIYKKQVTLSDNDSADNDSKDKVLLMNISENELWHIAVNPKAKYQISKDSKYSFLQSFYDKNLKKDDMPCCIAIVTSKLVTIIFSVRGINGSKLLVTVDNFKVYLQYLKLPGLKQTTQYNVFFRK